MSHVRKRKTPGQQRRLVKRQIHKATQELLQLRNQFMNSPLYGVDWANHSCERSPESASYFALARATGRLAVCLQPVPRTIQA